MSRLRTTLNTQRLEYDHVRWATESRYGNPFAVTDSVGAFSPLPSLDSVVNVTSAPAGLSTGMAADASRPPYWTFDYKIDTNKGLVLSNVNAKDTVSAGSVEEVFEKIEFSDLKIFFDDGNSLNFDIRAALTSTTGTFVWLSVGENGTSNGIPNGLSSAPVDSLYQRGVKLEIKTNVLAASGGTCYVNLAFSIAFRGSNNDFDPGGVPVAMIAWPQCAFQWSSDRATKRVVKFIGGIKISMNNKMHGSHMHHGVPLNENIVGLYTDSNTSVRDSVITRLITPAHLASRATYYSGFRSRLGSNLRQPFGWTMVFDFVSKLNMTYNTSTSVVTQREKEIIAVYGPDDGTKFTSGREQRYEWIPASTSPGIRVKKAPRQGMYDNMHNHARMTGLDSMGNVQIHAPFCGHSCIHTHWRWSNVSSWGYIYDNRKYRGWSATEAFALVDAPKAPPNQRVRVAICNASTGNSFSDTNILNPAALGNLDPLRKTFWYRAEIIRPNAGEWQVVMEQGIGWAFRYSVPNWLSTPLTPGVGGESDAVDGLTDAISDSLPWTSAPTQHDLAAFFENAVYPLFRYFNGTGPQDQVPEGNHNRLYSGSTGTSMEDL